MKTAKLVSSGECGNGMHGYFSKASGIPSGKSTWQFVADEDQILIYDAWSGCAQEGSVFQCVSGHKIVETSIYTGEQKLFDDIGEDSISALQIAISGEYLLCGDIVYHVGTKKRIAKFDLGESYPAVFPGREQKVTSIKNGFLCASGDMLDRDRTLLHIDITTLKCRLVYKGFSRFVGDEEIGLFFFNGYNLNCIDWSSCSEKWSRSFMEDRLVNDLIRVDDKGSFLLSISYGNLYVVIRKYGVYRFCCYSGKQLSFYSLDDSGFSDHAMTIAFSTSDVVYVVTMDVLSARTKTTAYELKNDNVLFTAIETSLQRALFIAGDLFFYSDDSKRCVFATDRYTGEIVWTSTDYIERMGNGFAIGNYYYFYRSGLVRAACYEWSDIYKTDSKKV